MTAQQRTQRLRVLHRLNGWNLVVLLLTGFLLYAPALRAPLAPVRTALKHFHAVDGLLTFGLLLAYLPLLPPHWRLLGGRLGQRLNVLLTVALTLGWTASGVIIWAHRSVPPALANAALVWHDWLTWVALPFVLLHSIFHWYQVRLPLPDWWVGRTSLRLRARYVDWARRRALTVGAVTLGAAALGAWVWRRVGEGALIRIAELPAGTAAPGPDQPLLKYAPELERYPAPAPLPGGGREGSFRVYTVTGEIVRFDPASWRFRVDGLVERPMQADWPTLLRELPWTTQVSDFHCVTGWSVYHITWEGVRLRDLLDRVGVQPEATHVQFISGDGVYTDSLPLEAARMHDVLVAWRMDGTAIPAIYGGPVRLVVPRMYAYKSVKWLEGIRLMDREEVGFWARYGYPQNAWIPTR